MEIRCLYRHVWWVLDSAEASLNSNLAPYPSPPKKKLSNQKQFEKITVSFFQYSGYFFQSDGFIKKNYISTYSKIGSLAICPEMIRKSIADLYFIPMAR